MTAEEMKEIKSDVFECSQILKTEANTNLLGQQMKKMLLTRCLYISIPTSICFGGEGPCQVILRGPKTKQALAE